MSWQLASFLIVGGALALGFAWYERSRPPARVLALVAALAALAVVGRLAFAPFPNVKPTTDIVLFSGYALGGAPGFAVGAVTALVSNIFFSHGPWTPWQMAAWGGVGIAGGALAALVRWRGARWPGSGEAGGGEQRELGRWPLALACGLAGLAFGVVMDLYLWTLGAEQTPAAYAAIAARSLPFNLAHIAGNVAFCLLVGPPLVRALRRYRRRFEVRWAAPAAGTAARRVGAVTIAVASIAAWGIVFAGAPVAHAASSSEAAARYLLNSQNRDGGFGSERGRGSAGTMTADAALGLAATGRNPHDVSYGGSSVIDYLRRNPPSRDDAGELERTILVLRAAGVSPRRFAGRNLHRDLKRRRPPHGSFGGSINHTAFGIMALRAAGERPSAGNVRESAKWLADQQNDEDGGFSHAPGGPSNADMTGAVLEALGAAGLRHGDTARDAVDYLKDAQDASTGGFNGDRTPVNAQSTAWAVQGLVAAGHGDGSVVRRALSYLRDLQLGNGSIPYSEEGQHSWVWATGQATAALEKRPFPLQPVPRRPRQPVEETQPRTRTDGGASFPAGRSTGDGRGRAATKERPRRRGQAGGGGGAGAGPGHGPGAADRAGAGLGTGTAAPAGIVTGPSSLARIAPKTSSRDARVKPNAAESAWRHFSGTGAVRTRPAASGKPGGDADRDERPSAGTALAAIGILAVGLMVLTGATARGRRLWAVARRRTT